MALGWVVEDQAGYAITPPLDQEPMADPNTQIDWWIAQAWQEAQGGAESDDLVVWLHGNGLTAVSSYTILQAALGCEPQEAKDIVFGHPVWADEATDLDVANLDYTSDTLEPEPEPDPAFELDDWAEQVEEEGPVYGEEGYQPTPVAAEPDEALTSEAAFVPADDFDDEGDFDNESGFDEELGAALVSDAGSSPMDDDVPSFAQPAESPAEFTPAFDPEPPVAPARPPILRTPPSTPAERAAVFAGAFGKKKDAPAREPVDELPAAGSLSKVPPLTSDAGPTGEAETSPAHSEPNHPHQTQAEASMPPPLVFEPLPEIELAPPVAPAEPLFTAAPCTPRPVPPVFLPAAPLRSVSDPVVVEGLEQEAPPPEGGGEMEDLSRQDDVDVDDVDAYDVDAYDEFEPVTASNGLDVTHDEAIEALPEEPHEEDASDLPPGMMEVMAQSDAERRLQAEQPDAGLGDSFPSMDGEEEPLSLGDVQHDDQEPQIMFLAEEPDEDEGDGSAPGFNEDEAGISDSENQALLSPSNDEVDDDSLPVALEDLPKGDTPAELAAAAKLLGISFRDHDPAEVGVDPDMAKTAKELGISFREGGEAAEDNMDEIALEAQRLGISFRDAGPGTGKPQKPLVVKYLPLLLGVIAIFFLLLLGATFAGDIIAWLWS